MKIALSGLILLGSISLADAQAIEGSRAFTFPENDNQLIELQKRGGDPARAGNVQLEFYGHEAFKITSPEGISVLAAGIA